MRILYNSDTRTNGSRFKDPLQILDSQPSIVSWTVCQSMCMFIIFGKMELHVKLRLKWSATETNLFI